MTTKIEDREVLKAPANLEIINTHELRRDELFATVKHLGEAAGRGASSLMEVAFGFQAAVVDGLVAADDASKVYGVYAEGFNSVGGEQMSSGSIQAQASILKTFGGKAACHLGRDLYARIVTLRKEVPAEDRTGSAYSNFAAVNRAVQVELEKTGKLDTLASVVSDAWIIAAISKKSAVAKSDMEKFGDVVKALNKLAKSDTFAGNTMFAGLAAYTVELHSHLNVKPFSATLQGVGE